MSAVEDLFYHSPRKVKPSSLSAQRGWHQISSTTINDAWLPKLLIAIKLPLDKGSDKVFAS